MRSIVFSMAFMSHRPAGAAKRSPEGAIIGRRHVQTPCMRMSMHAARTVASAGGCEGILALLVGACALLIAAECAYRGPVGHRRWQRRRQVLEISVAVNRLATDERQHRRDVLDCFARDREIVFGEDSE